MKVLVSAFAFSPYRGSECAVGWNLVTRLARDHEVTVLCGDVTEELRTRADLKRYFENNPLIPGLTIEYVAPSRWVQWFEKLHRIPGFWMCYYWAYNLWQRRAFQRAKILQQEKRFDLVHQLNMIGYREPGYLWQLGIPFFWGPVGGGTNESFAFWKLFSWGGCVKVFVRAILNGVQKRIALRPRAAARAALKIWAVTSADVNMIQQCWGVACEQMLETGAMAVSNGVPRVYTGEEPLRIVWSGIHTPRKALPILLYALARLERTAQSLFRLDVLGEGAETSHWRELAQKLSLDSSIHWRGRLAYAEAIQVMKEAHLLAFPSLKEGTPHVVLEALALGLPVICHDACGMGIAVTDACGVKVPLRSPAESIKHFANAIDLCLSEPSIIERMSQGALRRAQALSWDRRASQISKSYQQLVLSSCVKNLSGQEE